MFFPTFLITLKLIKFAVIEAQTYLRIAAYSIRKSLKICAATKSTVNFIISKKMSGHAPARNLLIDYFLKPNFAIRSLYL